MTLKKLLLVDNYDSFVFNLKHLFESLPNVHMTVVRNDVDFLSDLRQQKYDGLIIGPGPGSPDDINYFGGCMQAIKEFGSKGFPIFGVCLGFQGIAIAYGCTLKRATLPMHGKISSLHLVEPSALLDDGYEGTEVMRYHSLMIDMKRPFSAELKITAEVADGEHSCVANGREVMGIEHITLPLFGVQFHPESFGTPKGKELAESFVNRC